MTKKIFSILMNFLLIASLITLPYMGYALDDLGEELKLYQGEVKILSVSTPTRIAIGNPEVIDVTNVTKNEVTVNPKAVGATTLVIWDNMGEQSYRVKVFAENMEEIKQRVDSLLVSLNLPEVSTRANEEEGKVLLLGRVKTDGDRERINTALGPLKEKTIDLTLLKEEEAVVEIDVQLLELDKDATRTLGFTTPLTSSSTANITLTERGSPGIDATTGTKWGTVFRVLNVSRDAFTWKLEALAIEGKARILSQPKIACRSGKEAKLLVGGEVPIFTSTTIAAAGTPVTTGEVEYKEYGIILSVKPVVDELQRIHLSLNMEVSELGTVETTTYARAYPLTKRNATTELFLNNGQTLVIGGLIKQKTTEDVTKVPFLGDIPVLGLLFRRKTTTRGGGTTQRGDVELFITLTPTIVTAKEPTKEEPTSQAKVMLPVETKPLAAEDNILPELKDYIKTVQLKIINAVYYPQEAKDLGYEGTVNLILRLASNGDLKEAKIAQSSGYKLLDDAALDTVQKQTPYPAFPDPVKLEELKIAVPIVYQKN